MNKKLSLFLLACLCVTIAWAQNRQVKGRVISDSANVPVASATVVIKGTGAATTTNSDGRYSISVNGNNTVLVFSHVGFTVKEVSVGTKSDVDYRLPGSASERSFGFGLHS